VRRCSPAVASAHLARSPLDFKPALRPQRVPRRCRDRVRHSAAIAIPHEHANARGRAELASKVLATPASPGNRPSEIGSRASRARRSRRLVRRAETTRARRPSPGSCARQRPVLGSGSYVLTATVAGSSGSTGTRSALTASPPQARKTPLSRRHVSQHRPSLHAMADRRPAQLHHHPSSTTSDRAPTYGAFQSPNACQRL
jgi:hypothetical protein